VGLLQWRQSYKMRRGNRARVGNLPEGETRPEPEIPPEPDLMRKALRRWAKRYRLLFENLSDAAFLADAETGNIVEPNKEAEVLLGRPRSEIIGMHRRELHPPEKVEKYERMFAEHGRNRQSFGFDAEVVRKDGERIPVDITTSTVTIGGKRFILGLFHDVRRRKQIEHGLRKQVAFAKLISRVAARFVRLEPEEVDTEIVTALRKIGRFAGADRSYLFLFSDRGKVIEKTHEWCREGVESVGAQRALIPADGERSREGQATEQRETQRRRSRERQVKSSLTVSVGPEESPIGFLGLDYVKKEARTWSSEILPLLKLLGQVLVNALKRKAAEERLRESQRNLAEAQRLAHLGNWVWSIQSDKMVWSDETCHIFGVTSEEFGGTYEAFLNCVHPDDRQRVERAVDKALHGGEQYRIDHRIVVPGGSERVVHERGEVTFDQAGKPVRMVGTVQDITERKRVERALRESRQKLDAMLGSITDHMSMIDRDLTIIWANKTAKRLFGNDIVGRKCYEVYHGGKEPCESSPCLALKAFRDGAIHEHDTQVVDKDGNVRYFHCTASVALRDEAGQPTAVMEVSRDITEQKRAEDALRRAHRETEQLLSAVPSILIGVDISGTITRWNEAAERTFGIPAHDAVGCHFGQCGIQWDWVDVLGRIEAWQAAGRSQQLRFDDVKFVRPDGKEGLLGITVNAVLNGAGKREGFLVFAADITERRALESQLNQAQKLESIGQLAAGIAHEINTPTQYVGDNIRFLKDSFNDLLGIVQAYERLLKAAEQGSINPELVAEMETAAADADVEYLAEEIPKAIGQSLEGVDRVASIVRAMKEFSYPGGKAKTAVDINRAIENTVTVARNEWKYVAEMHTDFDESLPPVPCLPGEFNQVILNMIINAAHAIADVVGDGSNGKGRITIGTRRDDGWAEVRISDTGIGIPEAIRDRIFDPFFTTKDVGKGTGQGLSIARSVIVDKHGGTITFESETGKGTTFIVRLPLEEPAPAGSDVN